MPKRILLSGLLGALALMIWAIAGLVIARFMRAPAEAREGA